MSKRKSQGSREHERARVEANLGDETSENDCERAVNVPRLDSAFLVLNPITGETV